MKLAMPTICVMLLGCACGGAQEPAHGHLSTSEHYTEAKRHDGVAAGHEEAVKRNRERVGQNKMECIDRPLAGMPTSGTENVQVMRPCWTRESDPGNVAHRREAEKHRLLARQHRAQARSLIVAEQKSCAGLGEDEISHSPFWHKEDIASVTALKKGQRIVGVRTVFKKVKGLSAAWMSRGVACHQARAAAMGFKTHYMAYCPLMLPDIETSVTESKEGIVVVIRSKRSEMAAAALGRARHGDGVTHHDKAK